MKHKAWIENYEFKFEKLAEELGDLRYDSLAEFLGLLGEKIRSDGQKDLSRGRQKLAKSLESASLSLLNSAKHIDEAWLISVPHMYPKDVVQKIKLEFKTASAIKEAFKLLSDYYRDWETDEHFRLARCLLFETNGDIELLKSNIELADKDPRDLITQAEYDHEMNWLRNFNRPFGEEKIRPEDFDQHSSTISDDDGFPF